MSGLVTRANGAGEVTLVGETSADGWPADGCAGASGAFEGGAGEQLINAAAERAIKKCFNITLP